jgi:hypothetical protein
MKKSLVNKLVIPLVVSTGLSLGGCFPTLSHKGKAFRDSVGRQVVGDIIRTDIEKSQGHRDYQTNRDNYQRGQERVAHQGAPQERELITYRIINLNNERTETEVVGFENYHNYVVNRFIEEKFPEKGYVIVEKKNGDPYAVSKINEVKKTKGYLQIIKEQNLSHKQIDKLIDYMYRR